MQKPTIIFLLCLFTGITGWGQNKPEQGHDIALTLAPIKGQWVYLGFYYGKIKALADE